MAAKSKQTRKPRVTRARQTRRARNGRDVARGLSDAKAEAERLSRLMPADLWDRVSGAIWRESEAGESEPSTATARANRLLSLALALRSVPPGSRMIFDPHELADDLEWLLEAKIKYENEMRRGPIERSRRNADRDDEIRRAADALRAEGYTDQEAIAAALIERNQCRGLKKRQLIRIFVSRKES